MKATQFYGSTGIMHFSTSNLLNPTLSAQQAECFLDDAEEYRSINHRIDGTGLKLYRFLFSKLWRYALLASIIGLHCLAFLEFPSSLSGSSYINENRTTIERIPVPLFVTCGLEGIFLIIILVDAICQGYLFGSKTSLKNPWLIAVFVLMFTSWIDFLVSVNLGELYYFRLRRFFRPVFAMHKSQLMKKVLKSLSKTIADIFSAFLLLILWVTAFTLLAVSLFKGFNKESSDVQYETFYNAFFTLLVLLTTANNPDAMINFYNQHRLAFIFYLVFMCVGIFVFMNVLMAIVFNEFRNHVLDSMQTSLFRRRIAIRALYEVIRGVSNELETVNQDEVNIEMLRHIIQNSSVCDWRKREMEKALDSLGIEVLDWQCVKFVLSSLDDHKESKMLFNVPKYKHIRLIKWQKFLLSKSFEIMGLVVCLINVIVIAIDVDKKFTEGGAAARTLNALNWLFIILYILEQTAKFCAMGHNIYFSRQGCIIDFFITLIILIMKISETIILIYISRENYITGYISVWDLSRITNLLILGRVARIVLLFPALTPIINTLFDIPYRMKSVIGFMSMLFYIYALLGMNIFGDKIDYAFIKNGSDECGSYQQLKYGGINFNDFYSSLVVLWCLLIVNNWHVFMIAFEKAMGGYKIVHMYMISWWIMAVILVMNCVTVFVIEAYIQRKSYYDEERIKKLRPQTVSEIVEGSIEYLRSSIVVNNSFTFQMLFKQDLVEPTDEELLAGMKKYHFLCEQYPHIAHSHYES